MTKNGCDHCPGGPFKGFCPFSLVLFTGTALSYVRYLQSKSKPTKNSPEEPLRVVFVLGGPGAGKVRIMISDCVFHIIARSKQIPQIFRARNVNSFLKIYTGPTSLPVICCVPSGKRKDLNWLTLSIPIFP